MTKQLPSYMKNLTQEALEDTLQQLDAATHDIVTTGKLREDFYTQKADLMKRKRQWETAVELKVAEAYMAVRGEARAQYVMIGGEKVALTNEEARKAYANTYAKEERESLSAIDAELAALEVERFHATDDWERAREAARSVQAKATLQAAVLSYLA